MQMFGIQAESELIVVFMHGTEPCVATLKMQREAVASPASH